jgi:hypothetical protein
MDDEEFEVSEIPGKERSGERDAGVGAGEEFGLVNEAPAHDAQPEQHEVHEQPQEGDRNTAQLGIGTVLHGRTVAEATDEERLIVGHEREIPGHTSSSQSESKRD